jgi:pimeloyl-ACP methyl ester carboxylesterase
VAPPASGARQGGLSRSGAVHAWLRPLSDPGRRCYGLGALVADAIALHEALDADERAVLIGHDWGAEAAYGAAAFAPERWRRVVTIAVPPFALDATIFADYEQLKRFFYLFLLQTPLADAVVAADEMAFLDRLWRDWSPDYDASQDLSHAKDCLRAPENRSAAIGYYRAYDPSLAGKGTDDRFATEQAALGNVGPQPTLYLHGNLDGCISLDLVRDAKEHLPTGSQMTVIDGAGHFPHLEKSVEVNKHILAWITA